MGNLWVFETNVFIIQEDLFAFQNVENLFLTIYFHYLLHGDKRGYKGLQVVTGGQKGLQMVTGGYNGLQEITRGYRGLRGVTGVHRGLKGVTEG